MTKSDKVSVVKSGLSFRFWIGIMLVMLTAGVLTTGWTVNRTDRELREYLLQEARIVVQAMNVESVVSLSGTQADLESSDYLRIKEQLAAIRSANSQCMGAYLMGRNVGLPAVQAGGAVFFFADSEPTDSKDYSPPGQVYEEDPESYRRVFDSRAASVVGPVTGHRGTWVSVLVPLIDRPTALSGDVTQVDAREMVRKAVDFYRKNGRERFLKEANIPQGIFHKGSLYVFAYDLDMTMKAHPMKPELVGQNLIDKTDWAGSKYFRKEIQEVALSKGRGWVDYQYENPVNRKVMRKTTYVEKVDGLIVCAGSYKGTGDLLAVLRMDIDARTWKWEMAARAALPAGLMLMLLIGMIATLAATHRANASPRPVLRRLLPSLAAMVAMLVLGAAALLWQQFRMQLDEKTAATQIQISDSLRTALDNQASMLAMVAEPIAADPRVHQALRAGDADRLLDAWRPVFKTLHRENNLTHFYFFDKNRVCILRVHDPENRGDLINRFTALEAEHTGTTSSGIELGPLGSFSLRVVRPIFREGELTGYVELGEEIGDILHTLVTLSGHHVAVAIRKAVLNRQAWEEGIRMLGREADWDRLPHNVIIYASQGHLPDAFAPMADHDPVAGRTHSETTFNGKDWRVSMTPLQDALGKEVGCLLVMSDISPEKTAFHRMLILGGVSCGVLLAVLLGFVFVMLHRTDAGIRAQHAELRVSEERFSRIFDKSPIPASLSKRADSKYTEVNSAWCNFFGFSKKEATGRTPEELNILDSETLVKLRELFLRKGVLDAVEVTVCTKSGKKKDILTSVDTLSIGNEQYSVNMIIDVTDRKRVEEAIQRNQRILRLFVEHTPAAIAMLDAQMNYICASRRFLTDYDLGDQDIIGKSYYEVFPEIPERWKEIHRRCLMGATERCDEDPFQRASGKLDWIRWEIRPWFEQADKIGGIILFSEVITGQKMAAQELHESEKKFRDLFHKHAAVKFLIDPDTGNIVEANEAAEKFYGWSLEQLRRMRIQDINTLSPEQVKAELNKVMEQQCIHFEFRHRLANSSVRDVEVFSSAININGRVLLHSIIHDITARRNLEGQLRQAQKMESVGHLAGGVAHDFNNMLSIILGYTEIALLEAGVGTSLHDNLLEISKAANRSADLTRQLLAFARKQTIQPKVLDLNGTVEDMLKMLRRLIGENINLVWLPGASLWPVKMDPAQIDQVMANLCVNARDAITSVGKITIETQNVILDETYCAGHAGSTPGEFVMFAVSDNGCGMDDEIMRRLFDPFFTTKELGKGTGLGLSTVYGIVKQNEGFINVYSEPGRGSNFKIYIPRYAGSMVEARTARSEGLLQGHGEIVLMVEDEPAILAMGKRMLEKLGYSMLSAGTPGESLRLAGVYTGEIHLLMTDVIMPEMNGRELAQRLHAIRPGMKCLFMSGYTANVIVHHGVLEEGVHFIQKPFTMNDLSVKVRKVLDE